VRMHPIILGSTRSYPEAWHGALIGVGRMWWYWQVLAIYVCRPTGRRPMEPRPEEFEMVRRGVGSRHGLAGYHL
jgi:hypothetical protein